MVFNRHLKALNLCNHSDTIACVLYELLVVSISKVAHFKAWFLDWLIWNWLTWVSKPTIKVPQVSVLFNFQGPAALSVLVDSLLIIQHQVPFVKNFFEVFSDFLKVFNPRKTRTSCCYGLFSACPSRDSLIILPQAVVLCQQVFWIFRQISGGIFGQCVYCGGLAFWHKLCGRLREW